METIRRLGIPLGVIATALLILLFNPWVAIDEGPLPVRTPIANVRDGEATFSALVRSNREKNPGDEGFIIRDQLGWLAAKLTEVVTTAPDASTMSAEQMAAQLGMTAQDLKDKLK